MRVWHKSERGRGLERGNFNSHTREGVTCSWWECKAERQYFNSHTREGVTETATGVSEGVCNFNSHTREGVTFRCLRCCVISVFQLTHPWGCDFCKTLSICPKIYFNSHTREGVTYFSALHDDDTVISTHTPVRVWRSALHFHQGQRDFNSHTREGVTCNLQPCQTLRPDFNSHTREGVTQIKTDLISVFTIFQLTHPWGCDRLKLKNHVWQKFQLTHPWGCDLYNRLPLSTTFNFNSHTREGVTFSGLKSWGDVPISTHTPVRVWHKPKFRLPSDDKISTHTPVRVWHWYRWHYKCFSNFNSHTREGVTEKRFNRFHLLSFQLTHPWGCDLYNKRN